MAAGSYSVHVRCEPMAPISGLAVLQHQAGPVGVRGAFRSLLEAGDGSHCLDGRLVQSDGHSLTITRQSSEQVSRSEGGTTTKTTLERLSP